MANLIVKGMDMPKYTTKAEFGIDADGNPLCMVYHENGTEPDIYDVVPLPDGHGRLIDANELELDLVRHNGAIGFELIGNAPTVVPAEGGTDNG